MFRAEVKSEAFEGAAKRYKSIRNRWPSILRAFCSTRDPEDVAIAIAIGKEYRYLQKINTIRKQGKEMIITQA